MGQMPEMTAAELANKLWKLLRVAPGCEDLQFSDINIESVEVQGSGPNWTVAINRPLSNDAMAEANSIVAQLQGQYALRASC